MTSTTWRGRKGAVLLGPTEDRVARYLADATRHGRVTIRTVDIVRRLNLSRSETYRITRQLRTLGLFGIEDDQGGTHGGRRYWRTAVTHDGSGLDAVKHRVAWGRILAWARARRSMLLGLTARDHTPRPVRLGRTVETDGLAGAPSPDVAPTTVARAGPSFRDMFAAAGGASLLEAWGR